MKHRTDTYNFEQPDHNSTDQKSIKLGPNNAHSLFSLTPFSDWKLHGNEVVSYVLALTSIEFSPHDIDAKATSMNLWKVWQRKYRNIASAWLPRIHCKISCTVCEYKYWQFGESLAVEKLHGAKLRPSSIPNSYNNPVTICMKFTTATGRARIAIR